MVEVETGCLYFLAAPVLVVCYDTCNDRYCGGDGGRGCGANNTHSHFITPMQSSHAT
jgi:hypothetical protein